METITVLKYIQTRYDTKKHSLEPGDQNFTDQWKSLIKHRKEDDTYVNIFVLDLFQYLLKLIFTIDLIGFVGF